MQTCLELLQLYPGPAIHGVRVTPYPPLCLGKCATRVAAKPRVPLGCLFQGLALTGGVHNCASKANSRQCSVAFAMYFVTELTETPSCSATC